MKKRWMGLLIVAGFLAGTVFAETTSSPEHEGWEFAVAPYLWMAGIEGTAGTVPGLPAASVDASFSDILENLDIALMAVGEARYGKWAVVDDFMYLNLSAGGQAPAPVSGKIEADITSVINTLAAAYRVVEDEKIAVDLYAGARLWHVDTEGTLSEKMSITLGGFFGMGASDEDWSLMAMLNYDVKEWVALTAGYRHMSVDYQDGGFVYDVEMSGPVLGAVFRF